MWWHSPSGRIPVSSKNTNLKLAISLATVQACASRRSKQTSNPEDLKHTSCKQVQFMQKEVPHMTTHDEESTSEESLCLQVKIKHKQDKEQSVPRPTHLITNLAYRLKPNHTRNQLFESQA